MSASGSVDKIHPNLKRLSHSSSVLLHKCPRKYELYKLMPEAEDRGDEHTDFGHLVGAGVQEILVSNNLQKAYMAALLSWTNRVLDDEDGERDKKTFWHGLHAIEAFFSQRNTAFSGYQLAILEWKPAIELGYSIDCGDGFSFRGKLDALLINSSSKRLAIYEGKTTKFSNVNDAMYRNSGQALGYSLVVEKLSEILGLSASSFEIIYNVYKTKKMEWEEFRFNKSDTQRALWIKNLLIDIQHVSEYAENNYFPMHGETCFDFFKPCPYFGYCETSNQFLVPAPEVKKDREGEYQFSFSLDELIEEQLKKMGEKQTESNTQG